MGAIARLGITVDEVAFEHVGVMARHCPGGELGQIDAELRAVAKARHRTGAGTAATDKPVERYVAALDRLGRRLGEHFLAGEAGAALCAALRAGEVLRLAVEVEDPALVDLPWEMTVPPGESEPFALDRRVQVFRRVPGRSEVAAVPTAGPLRILAVVASPELGGEERLDYEAEVDRLLSATDPAVHGGQGAEFEKEEWGSLAAIEARLCSGTFHVLHVTAHAAPGLLVLEDDGGYPDYVSTARFAASLLSSGHVPPLVVLSACSTGLGMKTGSKDSDEFRGMARELIRHGVPTVLAMTASVSDLYATELAGTFYQLLAADPAVDPLTAFTQARQDREQAREQAERTAPGQAQVEWWVPTLFTGADPGPLYIPAERPVPQRTARIPFVGRRAELRTLGRVLQSHDPHIMLHGLGGSGVRSLANALAERLPGTPRTIRVRCDRGVGGVLYSIADALNLAPWQGVGSWFRYLDTIWPAIQHGPVLLLIEVPDAALLPPAAPGEADWLLVDQQLAWFFTAWTQLTPTTPLVLTARRRFALPGTPRIHRHQVGPLHPVEARLLARRLSTLDADAQTRMLQAVGGHPGIYQRVAMRASQGLPAGNGVVDRLVASAIDEAADAAGLTQLAMDADWQLLLDVAVFRVPVGADAFGGLNSRGRIGTALDRLCAAGLVARADDRYLVDRWIAGVMLQGRPADAADAHLRAAAYWRRNDVPGNPTDWLLEARHHLKEAGKLRDALLVNDQICRTLADLGWWSKAYSLYEEARGWGHPAPADAARIEQGIGDLCVLAGDDTKAQQFFDQALAGFRRDGDEAEIVGTLGRLGALAIRNGEESEGQKLLDQARARGGALPPTHGIADTYRHLGLAELKQKRYTEAEAQLRRALARYEAEQDHRSACLVHIDIGDLYRSRELRYEANVAYGNALSIGNAHPSVAVAVGGLVCQRLGTLAVDMGLIDVAAERYDSALEMQRIVHDLPGQARTYRMMAALYRKRDNYESAVAALNEALDLAEDIDDDQTRVEGLAELADLYQRQGRNDDAMDTAVRAFKVALGSAAPFAIEQPLDVLNDVREEIGARQFDEGLRTAATDAATLKQLRTWLRWQRRLHAPSRRDITVRQFLAFVRMSDRNKPQRLLANFQRQITGYFAELTRSTFAFAVVTAVGVLMTGALLRHTGLPEALKALLFMALAGVEVAGAAHRATVLRGLRRAPNWFVATISQPVARLAGLVSWLIGLASLKAGLSPVPNVLRPLLYPRWKPPWSDFHWWPFRFGGLQEFGVTEFVQLGGFTLLMLLAFMACAAIGARLRTGQPVTWPAHLRPASPRPAYRNLHIDVVLKGVADDQRRGHTRKSQLDSRQRLIRSAVKAQRSGLTSQAVDALVVAHDLDRKTDRWPTREVVHELATRMAESTEAVMGAAPPIEVLDLLGQAIEREPVRGRAALAAYCTHLSLPGLTRRDPDDHHLLEAAVRAVALYVELVPTDARWFQPVSAIASADAAHAFREVGLSDISIDHLRSVITTLREHPLDVGWWRANLARLHVKLARSFIALHRNSEGINVVHEMLADIDQYFAEPGKLLPTDLDTSVNELRDWADGSDSADRIAEGPR
ncbi:tetratricopeptide repeat protein [Streptomyces sp. NPDC048479]|uniref:tetratricopeptide repeat protein n=1 Tax=Streptomyces sp. NPDC048479 TaxID=3154725 RepID=UPI0034138660